jgi:ParB family chromosome partitioning protein
MSIADKLGTGSSFSQVARGRSARGRAKAVAQGDVPAYELVRLRLDEVSPTPLNPRRNFGTDAELTRFGEELRQAQLAACVVVTRDAYLALWPAHEEQIKSARFVLVNGERRYRSADHVGLETLDFVVRDDLAASRETFINHLLKENLEREDFDVMERARGVQQLVGVCAEKGERGAKARAAEQLGRDRSWVTNQLVLLMLPEELQVMLSAGSLAERDGRYLARHLKENPGLDAAALLDHLEQTKAAAALAKEQQKAVLQAVVQGGQGTTLLSADNKPTALSAGAGQPEQSPTSLSADNKPAESAGIEQTSGSLSADNNPSKTIASRRAPAEQPKGGGGQPNSSQGSSSLPMPRHKGKGEGEQTEGQEGQLRQLPYDDPAYVAMHLAVKMEPEGFSETARVMTAKCWDKAGLDASLSVLRDMLETATQRAPDALRTLLEEFTRKASPS